ncbi:xylulokinase [Acidihalobacter ferrooxydans]|uniref:Xylulose kinase n=1 Tax=Acidihalobacter ferrooxydans TaxID=1765967 RepID=A0A1P8UHD6_9GAMM|nr:xylulokinase [Acidihalobacter ferrooxydans]APZ43258.1 xylulokinase [Acidihalobacter ferrooxydans]
MYLGIDLGTSGVKALLLDEEGSVCARHTEALPISRPSALWAEQNPTDWWHATDATVRALGREHALDTVRAIGLSGQMHGATLLDARGRVLRPAILWNDGRSTAQCAELEQRVPDARRITGNLIMPGFTAPKLLWVQENEPAVFGAVAHVLLPKDYLRLRLTGEYASDMSDSAGTMWLDVGGRDWSDEMLAASGLDRRHMPALYEGDQITGHLHAEIARAWGMKRVPVVAGGGDNAAGAIGVGLYRPGQAMLSLGTSGVYFAVSDGFLSNPDNAVHSFCHALPDTWHLMSVMLSAASCLDWAARLTGTPDVATLLREAARASDIESLPWFLPYLSGERTPHNDPYAKGVFFGLTHRHGRPELARAVLEGVGFGLADGIAAVGSAGQNADRITLIGGGARSALWRQMLADISGRTLEYRSGSEIGPALGAARLAHLALEPDKNRMDLLPQLPLEEIHEPTRERHEIFARRRETFSELYRKLRSLMQG